MAQLKPDIPYFEYTCEAEYFTGAEPWTQLAPKYPWLNQNFP